MTVTKSLWFKMLCKQAQLTGKDEKEKRKPGFLSHFLGGAGIGAVAGGGLTAATVGPGLYRGGRDAAQEVNELTGATFSPGRVGAAAAAVPTALAAGTGAMLGAGTGTAVYLLRRLLGK
jgi:hypothetical protein